MLAFLVAPIAPALYFSVLMFVPKAANIGVWSILIFFVSLFVSYLATLCFGLPVFAILKKTRRLNLINLVIAGCFIGVVSFYLASRCFVFFLDSSVDSQANLRELAWGVLFGGVVSSIFGLIAGLPWRGSGE